MKSWNDLKKDTSFWTKLEETPLVTLFLDYDGTLAPFVENRDKAFPYPGVTESLEALGNHPRYRLILVTGREIHVLERLMPLEASVEVWGSHGAQHKTPDGNLSSVEITPEQRGAIDEAVLRLQAMVDETLVEVKQFSVALHLRGLDRASLAAIKGAQQVLEEYKNIEGLELHVFDGGVELRLSTVNKGHAVKSVLEKHPDSVAIYLGDDRTDEDAFAVLREQDLSILVRNQLRSTLAQMWLRPPEELLSFFSRILEIH